MVASSARTYAICWTSLVADPVSLIRTSSQKAEYVRASFGLDAERGKWNGASATKMCKEISWLEHAVGSSVVCGWRSSVYRRGRCNHLRRGRSARARGCIWKLRKVGNVVRVRVVALLQ